MGKEFKVCIQNNTLGEWVNVNNEYLEYLIQVSYAVPMIGTTSTGTDNINGPFKKPKWTVFLSLR